MRVSNLIIKRSPHLGGGLVLAERYLDTIIIQTRFFIVVVVVVVSCMLHFSSEAIVQLSLFPVV